MSTHRREPTFAQIVAESMSRPTPVQPLPSGFTEDGRLRNPDGLVFDEVTTDVAPSRALKAARDGALVVHDSCGCGGSCGLTWLTPEQVRRLVEAGEPRISPRKKHQSGIEEWHAEDGTVLLVAYNFVWWGDALA